MRQKYYSQFLWIPEFSYPLYTLLPWRTLRNSPGERYQVKMSIIFKQSFPWESQDIFNQPHHSQILISNSSYGLL